MKTVILKLDDVKYRSYACPRWNAVFELAISKKIKMSAGIIGSHLDSDNKKLFDWMKKISESGYVEFWNHGFIHKKIGSDYEFLRSGFDAQYESIKKTQTLGLEKLNLAFSTFGAPFNKIDADTEKALEKFEEIKVWFGGFENSKSKVSLSLRGQCEKYYDPHLNPKLAFYDISLKNFKEMWMKNKDQLVYQVIQLHPGGWKKDGTIGEFREIVNFLADQQDVRFMTPSEYAGIKNTQ